MLHWVEVVTGVMVGWEQAAAGHHLEFGEVDGVEMGYWSVPLLLL